MAKEAKEERDEGVEEEEASVNLIQKPLKS